MDYSGNITGLVVVSSVLFAFISYVEKPLMDKGRKLMKDLKGIDFSALPEEGGYAVNEVKNDWDNLVNDTTKRKILNYILFLILLAMYIALYFLNMVKWEFIPLPELIIGVNLLLLAFFVYTVLTMYRVIRKHKSFSSEVETFRMKFDFIRSLR